MEPTSRKRPVRLVLEDGEPRGVILDIQDYIEMLERLEDAEDLAALNAMRQKPLEFRRFEEFLGEYA